MECAAREVRAPAQIEQRIDPRAAERHLDQPLAPRVPEGVGDHHRELDAEALPYEGSREERWIGEGVAGSV